MPLDEGHEVMNENIYRGTAGELLRLAEDRTRRLEALRQGYLACPWWRLRKRKHIRECARNRVAEIKHLIEWSAIADGETP